MGDKHVWSYDGQVAPTIGLNAVAGKPSEQWGMDPIRYEDLIPGCHDPVARVADMDADLCRPRRPCLRAAPLLPGDRLRFAAFRVVPSALLGLLHR